MVRPHGETKLAELVRREDPPDDARQTHDLQGIKKTRIKRKPAQGIKKTRARHQAPPPSPPVMSCGACRSWDPRAHIVVH